MKNRNSKLGERVLGIKKELTSVHKILKAGLSFICEKHNILQGMNVCTSLKL